MPFPYQMSPWDESLLEKCKESKKLSGFDGKFSLPDEDRVLLDAAHDGLLLGVARAIEHLKLDRETARSLVFSISQTEPTQTVEVIAEQIAGYYRR